MSRRPRASLDEMAECLRRYLRRQIAAKLRADMDEHLASVERELKLPRAGRARLSREERAWLNGLSPTIIAEVDAALTVLAGT